jgi:hypothetical protein
MPPRSRASRLAVALVVLGLPVGFCLWTEVLPTRTLNRVYGGLRPGLPAREAIGLSRSWLLIDETRRVAFVSPQRGGLK